MTEITLLDGGLGQELIARSHKAPTPLWSTQAMLDNPGLAQAIHADFFAAGATVATANTYAMHRDRLVDTEHADRFAELHAMALGEARAARDAHGSGRVAGAIGPLVASYQFDRHPDHDTAVPLYSEVARIMTPHVDFLICETVASVDHLVSVLEGAMTVGVPVWIALTVDDRDGTLLRSGEPVAAAAAEAAAGGAEAILANCSAPEAMAAALYAIAPAARPFGAYANAFTQITADFLTERPTVDALSPRPEMTPELYADIAMGWVAQGATIVGGCCEVGPAHIAELARRLRAAGHDIV
ncbi:homocysteine S-methyltransferase family protein [Oceaniglobus indicus]|uniref:homocysteine S-methyltransferase family protein n=1 Tax=Oceaniglobus indicus TaxID=2047749 RepID=UPI000C1A783F|nr:homocysteine S-methyltransferase family protein [Oceaniglobus indicus]